MTRTIQLLRGTTAQNAAFTGASGEVTVDTQTHELRVHDGSTVGGHIIYTKSDVDTALSSKADAATTLAGYGITDGANINLSNLTNTGKANVSAQGTYDSGATYSAGTVGDAIQNKANIALDNLTSAGKEVCANMSMPSATYIDLTVGVSGSTYTAPADGWFVAIGNGTGGGDMWIELFGAVAQGVYGTVGWQYKVSLPVRKGRPCILTYNNISFTTFKFVYAQGAQ